MFSRKFALFLALAITKSIASAETTASQPLGFGPISYFEQNCARCHGSLGSNYGDKFGANLNDRQLVKVVKEMCDGPGNAPLHGTELDAEVAFHRALTKKEPFISCTSIEGSKLTGEATPGSEVTVISGDQQSTATRDEEQWSVQVPAGGVADIVVRASFKGKSASLTLASESYSHRKP